jgi:dTDP-4-dehydrorhamnose 3,5-epimerase
MELIKKVFDAVLVIQPAVFKDNRGYFFESYSEEKLANFGLHEKFVQDNESLSTQVGVLRGLHFQNNPYAQGKLVRVTKGAVYDIALDIRTNSETYGQHFGCELNELNKTMMYIPPGFAHGFVTLQENTIFNYKCTNNYNKASEGGIAWDDSTLNIDWQVAKPILSDKDKTNERFDSFKSLF